MGVQQQPRGVRVDDLWVRLARVPRGVAFFAALVLVVAGLFLPGAVGGVLLLLLAAALGLLARHTWRVTPPSMRTTRVVVLVALAVAGLLKIFWGAW
jgi:hypothetical protein